jgi:pyruvate,water dikinase
MKTNNYVVWFEDIGSKDGPIVGGKNASLGEMIRELKDEGIQVPDGFATTAQAYREFLAQNKLEPRIRQQIELFHKNKRTLDQVGARIRKMIAHGTFSDSLSDSIRTAYQELSKRYKTRHLSVAARSSATAEDLPEASFAGQQESFLNVTGPDQVLESCRRCFASLFTNRAISYREEKGFDHLDVALSVGIQKMVQADKGGAGVMFTLDTDTGFADVVVINAAWGLGETIVGGEVNPDDYLVFKPLLGNKAFTPILNKRKGTKEIKAVYTKTAGAKTKTVKTSRKERATFVLSDPEILTLARWGCIIEKHYGHAMDIEWAKDKSGAVFIVQARPETVQSRKKLGILKSYSLHERSKELVRGTAIGDAIATGKVRCLEHPGQGKQFRDHEILVTQMTDPDWGPIMERAAAVVTDLGGRTAHAAIVSRELGIPAVVGCGNATRTLRDGQEVTVSCAEGAEGIIYRGRLPFEERDIKLADAPQTRTRIMLNIASPGAAMRWHQLPCQGIGLARIEFVIGNIIQVHPMALVHPERVQDKDETRSIKQLTAGYKKGTDYFVEHLAYGIAQIAASQYPNPVIVRTSDFKTNEYAGLIGGKNFEPKESNPMLGFRGASRYYSGQYRKGFALECQAIRRVREEMGLENVIVMIPFCRTPEEADRVLEVMREEGLERGRKGLKVYVMIEIPSNVLLAAEFADRFDGFSIGSNDLTQLVLGVDRDSRELKDLFDEQHRAVKQAISQLIREAHRKSCPVGICGQAPSDHPAFAQFLVEAGIDSISLNPDSVLPVLQRVAQLESAQKRTRQSA